MRANLQIYFLISMVGLFSVGCGGYRSVAPSSAFSSRAESSSAGEFTQGDSFSFGEVIQVDSSSTSVVRPSTPPTPGATGSASTTGQPQTKNYANLIISDMTLPNDGTPLGGVARAAGVQMGLMGRGDYTQSYWKPNNKSFKSATWWTALSPWWNVFTMNGGTANNTRIEISTMVTYAQSKASGAWRLVNSGKTVWSGNYNAAASIYYGAANEIKGSVGGSVAYKAEDSTGSIHGGTGVFSVDPANTSGIVVCLAARLVVDAKTGIDDRARANYGMWVGADWYPYQGFNVQRDVPELGWVPAVGTSRLKRITNDWQTFCMAPLDKPGRNDGDSNSSGTSMSTTNFRNNPPPISGLPL